MKRDGYFTMTNKLKFWLRQVTSCTILYWKNSCRI